MPSPRPGPKAIADSSGKPALAAKGASGVTADSPAEAQGRRIVSTAFVRVGPDGQLSVALHSGRVVVLRDVVMHPKTFCGVQVGNASAPAKYCGRYAEVAAAGPGTESLSEMVDPTRVTESRQR